MKKIVALFGGAFNPITKGHAETAQFIRDRLKYLDEIWIMPAYSHTYNKSMIPSKHRIKMCKLVMPSSIKIFDYEILHKITGGTLNTYNHLKNNKKYRNYEFFWVIGMDNANTIENWVNAKEVIKNVKFIVVPRYGIERDLSKTWYCKYPHIFIKSNLKKSVFEISSTKVRTLLLEYYKTNDIIILQELEKYLDEPILNYILKNKLYEEEHINAVTEISQSSK